MIRLLNNEYGLSKNIEKADANSFERWVTAYAADVIFGIIEAGLPDSADTWQNESIDNYSNELVRTISSQVIINQVGCNTVQMIVLQFIILIISIKLIVGFPITTFLIVIYRINRSQKKNCKYSGFFDEAEVLLCGGTEGAVLFLFEVSSWIVHWLLTCHNRKCPGIVHNLFSWGLG